MVDYSLWEVIENGNAPLITQVVKGVETIISLATAEEKAQRRRDGFKVAVAMLTMRAMRFLKNTRRKFFMNELQEVKISSTRRIVHIETPTSSALVSCDGLRGYDWSDQAEEGPTNFALMAYYSTSSNSEVSTDSNCSSSCLENTKMLKEQNQQLLKDLRTSKINVITYKTGLESLEARLLVYKKNESVYEEDIKLLKREIHLREVAITELRRKLELAQKQKDEIQLIVEKVENSSKNLSKLLDCQITDKCKTGLGYNAIPPPYTGKFLPPKPNLSSLEEFVNKSKVSEPILKKPIVETSEAKASANKPKVGNLQQDLQDKGVIDSGYSRYMIGNMSHLTDYDEIDGGYVAFGGNPKGGKITSRGKFNGKANEEFFVRYSLNSKAFRVFNNRTRIVEENLYIKFSENTPNIAGSGPNWLFYIDALTKSMNYKPVITGNQSNGNAGTKACDDAGDDEKKVDEDPRQESECIDKEKEDNVNNTNNVNAVGTNEVNVVGSNINNELPFDHEMPALEDISTSNFSRDHEVDDEEADINHLDTSIQMDVKSAFVYRKIEKEVYVCQPLGFEDLDFPDKVYKVEKALYGLHQAPRAWYETLSTYLLDNGFHIKKIDKTLFIRRHKDDILLFQVYVDDIIFGSTKKELCNTFKKMMHEKFQMSSMGELTFFLGLQVKQNVGARL
uniref:Ribonuclease H-like domain-containing protein n=1 Tax=Tanacetum cinerariifolium TaxID=118510 RepID=A0A6L2MJI0_TANCI|nr:ribonuclease H-like domain-containing protein [Tanacetum cinerariifolium]